MNVAITGSSKPKKNHSQGLRPNRRARRDVIIGTLNKNKIPRLMKTIAPMKNTIDEAKLNKKRQLLADASHDCDYLLFIQIAVIKADSLYT